MTRYTALIRDIKKQHSAGMKRAKAIVQVDPDLVMIALAWLKGDITLVQASKFRYQKHGMQIYIDIARALKKAYEGGALEVNERRANAYGEKKGK